MIASTMRRSGWWLTCSLLSVVPAAWGETVAYTWSPHSDDGENWFYEVDIETGHATPLYTIPGRDLESAAALPDGRIVGMDSSNREYWQLLPTGERIGTPHVVGVDVGMEYDFSTDTLYALTGGTWSHFESAYLYRVDPHTGESSLVGYDLDHYADSLAIGADGIAYAADNVFQKRLYRVDLETGQLIPGPRIRTATGSEIVGGGGLAFDQEGTLWMTQSRTGRIYRLDPDTGLARWQATISAHDAGAQWASLAIPIPEPSTMALLLLGTAMVDRRKKGSNCQQLIAGC